MKLVIVESPAKCKKIESFLGDGYKCVASFGHIREFTNGLKSIDYNNNYEPSYKLIGSKSKYINNLFFCRIHQDFKYLPGTKKSPDENNSFKTSTNQKTKNLSSVVENKKDSVILQLPENSQNQL